MTTDATWYRWWINFEMLPSRQPGRFRIRHNHGQMGRRWLAARLPSNERAA